MKRIHLLVALAGLALALPLAATSSSMASPTASTSRTAGSRRGSRSGEAPTSTSARSRPAVSGAATCAPDEGAELVPNRGRRAIGVEVDRRNRLWVAGGPTGDGYVYDARTGADIAQFNFTDESATFVNDVVVTRSAAWFTDSMRQFLYKVPIGHNGRLGTPRAVPLTGDIVYQSGFNVNGIDATPNGKTLIIVQSNTAQAVQGQPARCGPPDRPRRRDRDRRRAPARRADALCRRAQPGRRDRRDQVAARPPVRDRLANDHL